MKVFHLTEKNIENYTLSIKKMLKESYEINFPEDPKDNLYFFDRIKVLKEYLQRNKAIVVGTKNEVNELVGFIWFFEKEESNNIHVNSIVVSSKYRKQGIGKLLWNEVEQYATQNSKNTIELIVTKENKDAVNFYKHNNFKVERLIMKKRL